ncbi:MAG: hypothetical protein WD055_01820 [Candidatus Dependentiae bacterium]
MFNKKTILMSICLLTAINNNAEVYRRMITGNTILISKLLKAIDGRSFGLHGQTIRAILKIRTRLVRMLQGTLQKDGSHQGSYTFDNTQYTIQELYTVEKQGEVDHEIMYNRLKEVKKDFNIQINPFVELGRGFKPQMLILIEESLRLHKRENSILHLWAGEAEGQDMVAFEENVQTFDDLVHFLQDLLNFLDDLISSCPKATKQFINSLETDREKKMRAQQFAQVFERQKQKINNYSRQQ